MVVLSRYNGLLLLCLFLQNEITLSFSISKTRISNNNQQQQHFLSLFQLFSTTDDTKWDYLDKLDTDDDDPTSTAHIARDMKYNKRNCVRSNTNFLAIQSANGPINDIYCRRKSENEMDNTNNSEEISFDSDIFWYIGKVARVSDISIEQCIERYYDLLVYHAAYLRPIELYSGVKTNQLQLWYAPGNSELEVAYNNPTVTFTKVSDPTNTNTNKDTTIEKLIKNSFIGFQGETYTSSEDGFRTVRNSNGKATKPEIQSPSQIQEQQDDDDYDNNDDNDNDNNNEQNNNEEFRMPTEKEMEEIYKQLEGKDINEVYEEQERRKNGIE